MIKSLFCLALVLLVSGCGGPTAPQRASVSGEVLVDGQPLSEGVISFIPTDGVKGPTSGTKVLNGRYQAK
ncbi:hypothetical protein [Planctomicrobium sp. SH527]|uniref:hypothetical protein n=1 Tax=Planctomicrobium sp. SH527 TaxID=3448123 RepID=UPI003F5B27C8